MTVADFCKWVERIRGLPAVEQALALRLAEQTDKAGIVEAVDWERLMNDSGLGKTAVREKLRPGGMLIDEGYVGYEPRMLGKQSLPARYYINFNEGD